MKMSPNIPNLSPAEAQDLAQQTERIAQVGEVQNNPNLNLFDAVDQENTLAEQIDANRVQDIEEAQTRAQAEHFGRSRAAAARQIGKVVREGLSTDKIENDSIFGDKNASLGVTGKGDLDQFKSFELARRGTKFVNDSEETKIAQSASEMSDVAQEAGQRATKDGRGKLGKLLGKPPKYEDFSIADLEQASSELATEYSDLAERQGEEAGKKYQAAKAAEEAAAAQQADEARKVIEEAWN